MSQAPKLRPLGNRVVVEPQTIEKQTAGGIYLPETADKDKPSQGTIAAIGNGKNIDGKVIPLQVKVGDKVLFGKYAGTSVKLENKEFLIMSEEDVMGVIE